MANYVDASLSRNLPAISPKKADAYNAVLKDRDYNA